MTYMTAKKQSKVDIEPGGGAMILSAKEVKLLNSGKQVVKCSGDAKGHFFITLKLTRPRSITDRFNGL
jgi:hypothetical protein